MISLSYTTLSGVRDASHTWINKQLGLKREFKKEFGLGKEAHRIIQEHVSGKNLHPYLDHIKDTFPIVEKIDFDPDCKFEVQMDDKYSIMGYLDGINRELGRFLEIKTSSNPWSISKFVNAMQRKMYAYAFPELKEAMLITCQKEPEAWQYQKPKVYLINNTEKDRAEALQWILDSISIIEKGDFTGGLDDNGKCTGCIYGGNCNFI